MLRGKTRQTVHASAGSLVMSPNTFPHLAVLLLPQTEGLSIESYIESWNGFWTEWLHLEPQEGMAKFKKTMVWYNWIFLFDHVTAGCCIGPSTCLSTCFHCTGNPVRCRDRGAFMGHHFVQLLGTGFNRFAAGHWSQDMSRLKALFATCIYLYCVCIRVQVLQVDNSVQNSILISYL